MLPLIFDSIIRGTSDFGIELWTFSNACLNALNPLVLAKFSSVGAIQFQTWSNWVSVAYSGLMSVRISLT